MADKKHLSILKQGAQAWKIWMYGNIEKNIEPDLTSADLQGIELKNAFLVRVDLSGANLREAALHQADLRGAKLINTDLSSSDLSKAWVIGADLRGANLCEAEIEASDLSEADLRNANLQGANLSEADLIGADLRNTNLSKATLCLANLRTANLSGANLNGADFRGAKLQYADLSKADLSNADFSDADLSGINLKKANLSCANLGGVTFKRTDLSGLNMSGVHLDGANFLEAKLVGANLRGAHLAAAQLFGADLRGADLTGADLIMANLSGANLSKAILNDTQLVGASLVKTDLRKATIVGANVYGISAWDIKKAGLKQDNLIVTPPGLKEVIVENIEVAQFVYLLLNNENIRDAIDTIGRKGVLLLGRFTVERKAILEALRKELRRLGFVPIVFDFKRPVERDFEETIMILSGLSLFVIADITSPKSSPLELKATVPNYMIPFVPIIQKGQKPFSMLGSLRGKHEWVLKTVKYKSKADLIGALQKNVIRPALKMHNKLLIKKARESNARSRSDSRKKKTKRN